MTDITLTVVQERTGPSLGYAWWPCLITNCHDVQIELLVTVSARFVQFPLANGLELFVFPVHCRSHRAIVRFIFLSQSF